ncbi:hypothetical protein [Fimbriimonas ginsengisoli]|nr:hypothetical protein [Fimbriimonas ginsengisoli]
MLAVSLASLAVTDEKSLDFWVGNWDAVGRSLNPDGKTWSQTKAENRIERVLGDKVVQESFTMGTFAGQSWSVYAPKAKIWRQTWVDNQGGYIDLVGGMENGHMVLHTIPQKAKPKLANRMIFQDITPQAFTWRWESTKDGGKNWQLQWELKYTRRA